MKLSPDMFKTCSSEGPHHPHQHLTSRPSKLNWAQRGSHRTRDTLLYNGGWRGPSRKEAKYLSERMRSLWHRRVRQDIRRSWERVQYNGLVGASLESVSEGALRRHIYLCVSTSANSRTHLVRIYVLFVFLFLEDKIVTYFRSEAGRTSKSHEQCGFLQSVNYD